MAARRRAIAAGIVLLALAAGAQGQTPQGQSVVDVPTRPGVTVRYLALAPDKVPVAVAILFTGGPGVANIPAMPGPDWAQDGNFLVRSRALFQQRGILAVVVDAPSDHKSGLGSWRLSEEYAHDIGVVVDDVRRRAGAIPLWLVGTSAGTLSAANVAARLVPPKGVDGLVLTSTVTQSGGRNAPYGQTSVYSVDLAHIKVPTLIVRHREDGCQATPPGDAEGLRGKLKNAPRTELLTFSGGDPPRSVACEALSRHGYLGIEAEVVEAIAAWMIRDGS